jgi:hypothetical protein
VLKLRRPPEPAWFAAHVADARHDVERTIREGREPSFPNLWTDERIKIAFHRAQHRKCGYCESHLSNTGHIDHFRPKGGVHALPEDHAQWGEEIPGTTLVRGRRCIVLADRGYHWLAYAWSNYVLSCERCNSGWKRTYFPVAEPHRVLPPQPEEEAAETPLVLDPFSTRTDPVRHLDYDRTGQIWPRDGSDLGWETIRTLGLERESLQVRRRRGAARVHDLVRQLVETVGEARDRTKRDLHALGSPDAEFAGMVRSIFEARTGHRWTDLFPADEPVGAGHR